MEGFCKGCLIKHDEPMDLLHYTEKNRRLFLYSTGLQVKRTETLTFQLCKDCYLNMKQACKFKKQCRTSDKRLKSYLALKEAGDTMDFCTYLRNNDDSLMFRLPMSGNRTPSNEKNKDEDNESTCTSIQNFMKDMLQDNEIPDAEDRIIREVIEDEADVPEDSLDSHWLQDDVSIDTDFRLDLSFSPFSTPRSNAGGLTPQRSNKELEQHKQTNNIDINTNNEESENARFIVTVYKEEVEENDQDVAGIDKPMLDVPTETNESFPVRFYVENTDLDIGNEIDGIKDCTINKNINAALKDVKEEYPLSGLINTPPVNPESSAPLTPTINDILFGTSVDLDSNQTRPGRHIEKYNEIEGDIDIEGDVDLEEFFQNDRRVYASPKEFSPKGFDSSEPKQELPVESKYDFTNLLCKLCDRKFNNISAIKLHVLRTHKESYRRDVRSYRKKLLICDDCGKTFHDTRNLRRHIVSKHLEAGKIFECKLCSVEFSAKSKLNTHMISHGQKAAPRKMRLECETCGYISTDTGNLRIHQRRHTKNYSYICKECGSGHYKKCELTVHMRMHTGEKPYACPVCDQRFARSDVRNRHLKRHTGERNHKCHYCGSKFIREYDLKKHTPRCVEKTEKRLASLKESNEGSFDIDGITNSKDWANKEKNIYGKKDKKMTAKRKIEKSQGKGEKVKRKPSKAKGKKKKRTGEKEKEKGEEEQKGEKEEEKMDHKGKEKEEMLGEDIQFYKYLPSSDEDNEVLASTEKEALSNVKESPTENAKFEVLDMPILIADENGSADLPILEV